MLFGMHKVNVTPCSLYFNIMNLAHSEKYEEVFILVLYSFQISMSIYELTFLYIYIESYDNYFLYSSNHNIFWQ